MTSLPVVPSNLLPAKGGSGFGVSYYRRAALCTRAFHLDRGLEAADQPLPTSDSALRGIYFHSMAEAYYGGKEYVRQQSDVGNLVSEANAWWASYSEAQPGRDFFGEVVGVELPISGYVRGVPTSGRVDLVVRTTKDSVARLERAGAYGTQPGEVWLIDHKTKGSRRDMGAFAHSAQFILYNYLYHQQEGVQPAGTIVNVIIGTKTPQFEKIIVPRPNEAQIKGVLDWIERTALLAATTNTPNYAACDLFGTCSHLTSGRCNRL